MLKAHWCITGMLQVGCRAGHQAAELVHLIRILLEKAKEWRMPVILISVDLKKAFDSISMKALFEYLSEHPLPLALQLALLRELLGPRQVSMSDKVRSSSSSLSSSLS